jgi:exonuclease III
LNKSRLALSSLRILAWNANGVRCKKQELQELIALMNLDIILISETHLKEGNRFRVPNYFVYRCDRKDTGGGGVAVLIKRNITHQALYFFDLVSLEAVGVNIELCHNGKVDIIAAYKSPDKVMHKVDVDKIFADSSSILMLEI